LITRTEVAMGTLVSIRVVQADIDDVTGAITRAFGWFHEIEARCSRFDPASELMQLRVGVSVPVSPILFEATQFALLLAAETNGAFDPTIGHYMEARGYNRHHVTGRVVTAALAAESDITYRDVQLDPADKSILLRRQLTLDLGAVAKGLAVDLAARELQPFCNFTIDAGGDLFLAGHNEQGEPWLVGIRDPFRDGDLIVSLRASNKAVCTSGNYERGEHILDPRIGQAADTVASSTVVAANAMLADALATAAFVLGAVEGLALLERMGVDGLLFTANAERYTTQGWRHAA
jgi:FAD:protein FMN transferase